MTREYQIAVIPGDGTGPEVVKEGLKVVKAASEKTPKVSTWEWEDF
ncbi:unnamed protein product [marine sediment metagenome]|uniref:Isopropylmalate dehydrogenase-like domain-containing protein n=1 Tax=marine sediment metagenome TaxID=412755 RepID=X0U1Y1_9ZZZZ